MQNALFFYVNMVRALKALSAGGNNWNIIEKDHSWNIELRKDRNVLKDCDIKTSIIQHFLHLSELVSMQCTSTIIINWNKLKCNFWITKSINYCFYLAFSCLCRILFYHIVSTKFGIVSCPFWSHWPPTFRTRTKKQCRNEYYVSNKVSHNFQSLLIVTFLLTDENSCS